MTSNLLAWHAQFNALSLVLGLALKLRRMMTSRLMRGQRVQDPEMYAKLPEPTDDENDMLDLAYGLTDTCAFLVDDLHAKLPFPI